jgi:hypothetical protein
MSARNSTGTKREGSGFLWVVLFLGLIALLFSVLTWPFRAIARRLPGRRERELQTAIDDLQADIRASRLLLEVLGPLDSKSSAKVDKRIAATEGHIKEIVEAKGWPEDLDEHGPGELAVELLGEAGVIDGMDWRSDPDGLRGCLSPLLKRRGISLDWSFVNAIEATSDGEALRNTNFLPIVGDHVEKLGFVLAQVLEGSDAYTFAVCSPDEFTRIDGLTCRSFTIRRLSSATGPAKEP